MPYEEWTLCACGDDSDGPHYEEEGGVKVWYADDLAYWKQLTDAEAAAEMWRARADMCSATPVFTSGAELQRFIRVWDRMATRPHARDMDYQ